MELCDTARGDRPVPTELWFPAVNSTRGLDLDERCQDRYSLLPGVQMWQSAVRDAVPRLGSFPLVLFSHGFGGHRRQSTFLCTHLASHGYIVAACDHVGNTTTDLMQALAGSSGIPQDSVAQTAQERPLDVSFLLDWLLSVGPRDITRNLERGRVGMCGHSFGGWTTLAVTARDSRVGVAMPLCPAGAPGSSSGEVPLNFDWARVVPTLVMAASKDSLLPLDGIIGLFNAVRAPKRLVVIDDADHMHFCDAARKVHELYRAMPRLRGWAPGPVLPFDDLCAEATGQDVIRGLCVAHLDAHLKGNRNARDLLASDLAETVSEREVSIRVS